MDLEVERFALNRCAVGRYRPRLGVIAIFERPPGQEREETKALAQQIVQRCEERGDRWNVAVVAIPGGRIHVCVVDPDAVVADREERRVQ